MSFVVETGTGSSTANSYCTEAFADDYHEDAGNADWNLVTNKEAALVKATRYMSQVYRSLWQGYRYVDTQSLDWPRGGVYLNDYSEELSIPSTIIPSEIKQACAELALKTYSEDELLTDEEQKVTMEMIGSITIKYSDTSSTPHKQYTSINALLRPYLKSTYGAVIR